VIEVELAGLEVFGYHGVLEEERRDGQLFLFDVRLTLPPPTSDRIEDAVDYRDVAERVRRVSESQAFRLLESLAAAVAQDLLEAFPAESVTVRVRKRPAGLPVEHSAATVTVPAAVEKP
jgi:dihydroneopterin aldolase